MRRDIQFLRGIAVLAVLFYHSNLGVLSQGYLGVDIFFVLSGFLITSIILKALNSNSFSFSSFYLRRAKRLLPALYSTLFFTTLISFFVLTNQQWFDYLDQLKGALTFTANMVLPAQSGYFESASEGKPLLHIWSLSLEEQYYFLLPICLFFLPKNYRLPFIIVITSISIYWCFSWVYSENQDAPFLWRLADSSKSEWAFYLLFTRAWELLAGSICAWLMLYKANIDIPKFFKIFALCSIAFACLTNINSEHPSIEALIVVTSTMIILMGSKEWLPENMIVSSIEKAGDWSYSIYLVHWPLFAFAHLSYVSDVPTTIKIVLLFISIALGYVQFRYVETPFRKGQLKESFNSWKTVVVATSILLIVPVASSFSSSSSVDTYSQMRRVNIGLGVECEGSFDTAARLKNACVTSDQPKIAVWGDSYAMHLVPGLLVNNTELAQLTKSVCGPIIGVAPVVGKYDSVWAKRCLEFNDNTIAYFKESTSITHVILSTTMQTYLNFDRGEYLTFDGLIKADHYILVDAFKNTVAELNKLNITPIIVSPPPKAGFDIGECLERKYGGVLLLRNTCDISRIDYENYQVAVNKVLSELESVVRVIWLKDYLCDEKMCDVYIDDTFIYRDEGHLSVDGSKLLLKDITALNF